jgi:hypothetical protein
MKIEAYMAVDPQGGAIFFRNEVCHFATIPLVSAHELAAAQADCAEWRTACEQKNETMQTHSDERQELQRQVLSLQADARQADQFTHKALDERDEYLRQLEAAQAREAQLREALEECRLMARDKFDLLFIDGVLALPIDHAALDARLAQERERCAVEVETGSGYSYSELAAAIRSMA